MTDSDKRQKLRYFFKEWVLPVIIALIIVLFLNKYVFILVTVPTGSMEDTIIPGDRLFVNELFDIDDVKRGDIGIKNHLFKFFLLLFLQIKLGNKKADHQKNKC
jgi:signal peptidase I